MKLLVGIVVLAISVVAAYGQVPAKEDPYGLGGLTGMRVGVKNIAEGLEWFGVSDSSLITQEELERFGVSDTTMKTQIALGLLRNGIRVLVDPDESRALGDPTLYLSLTCEVSEDKQMCTYRAGLDVSQWVETKRKPKTMTLIASKWHATGHIDQVSCDRLADRLKEDVAAMVDEFAYWFLRANPGDSKP